MSENYQNDVHMEDNQNGTVSFATEVVATIAGLAVTEVEGVASMANSGNGIAGAFARKNAAHNYTKGVRIDLEGNKVNADVSITVEYGSPVPDVARGIQENVKKAIETMSGLDVNKVDVHVVGVSFEKEKKAVAEMDEQQKKMLENSENTDSDPTEESAQDSEENAETVTESDD